MRRSTVLAIALCSPLLTCTLFGCADDVEPTGNPPPSGPGDTGPIDPGSPSEPEPNPEPSTGPRVLANAKWFHWFGSYADTFYWVSANQGPDQIVRHVHALDKNGVRVLGEVSSVDECFVAYEAGVLVTDGPDLVTFRSDGTKEVHIESFLPVGCTRQGTNAVAVGWEVDPVDQTATGGVAFIGPTVDFRTGVISKWTRGVGATASDVFVLRHDELTGNMLEVASFDETTTFETVAADVLTPWDSPMIADGKDLYWVGEHESIVRFNGEDKGVEVVLVPTKAEEMVNGSFDMDASAFYVSVGTQGIDGKARVIRIARKDGSVTELVGDLMTFAPLALWEDLVISVRENADGEELIAVPR